MDTFFETDECMLAYRLKRAGPKSIIFIHGLGASKSFFDTAFELTKFRDYTLATVDLPGCGESSWPESFSYSMRNQAGLVLKWIKGMGLDRITLAGHSMGGVIGLYVAEELGKKVTAFFNLEGNMGFEDCVFSGKIASLSPGVFEKLGLQQFKRSLREMLQKTPSPGLKQYYDSICHASPQAIHLSSISLVHESRHGNLKKRFRNLPGKKFYIFGERSVRRSARTFLDSHNIPYFIVPGSGHFMMDDQPDLFYETLLKALENEI